MLTQAEKAALRKSEGLKFGTYQWSLDSRAQSRLAAISQTGLRVQPKRKRNLAAIAALLVGCLVGVTALTAWVVSLIVELAAR